MIAYRYRCYNDNTKKEIAEGYVYLSSYETFNDKLECFSHIEFKGTENDWKMFLQYYLRLYCVILHSVNEAPLLGQTIENNLCYQAVDKGLKGSKKTKKYYINSWCNEYSVKQELDPEWYKEYPNELSLEESKEMYGKVFSPKNRESIDNFLDKYFKNNTKLNAIDRMSIYLITRQSPILTGYDLLEQYLKESESIYKQEIVQKQSAFDMYARYLASKNDYNDILKILMDHSEYPKNNDYNNWFEKFHKEGRKVFIENSYNQIKMGLRIACFTKTYKNPTMWAHYADNHRGICIGYNTLDWIDRILMEVRYDNNRKKYNFFDILQYNDEQSFEFIKNIATQKTKHWKYEEELRLIKHGAEKLGDLHDRIEEITLGCDFSKKNKNKLLNIINTTFAPLSKKPKIYQAFYDNTGNIDRCELVV